MNKIICLIAGMLLFGTLPYRVNAQAKQLHIIYIDNSDRGGTTGGLGSMMDYIFMKTLDSVNAKDKNISYLLYISNGDNPYYSPAPDKFANYINKLTERKTKYPSSLEDKNTLRSIIYKNKLQGYDNIVLDFYVTNYYLSQDLLNDYPGYLLNFFPKELQYVTQCPENNITVNIFYPAEGNKEKNLPQKLVMNDRRFASGIKYNFFGK